VCRPQLHSGLHWRRHSAGISRHAAAAAAVGCDQLFPQ
jgi:hypothetical protein